jgi:hypothetical protein
VERAVDGGAVRLTTATTRTSWRNAVLTLYLVDPDDERDAFPPPSAMTLAAFLRDPPPWTPWLERTVLMFDMLPPIFNDDINSFGYLGHIILQLEEVSARLTAGKYALLCTSGGEPLFLLLEPGEGGTEVSVLGTFPEPYNGYSPTPRSPNHFEGVDQAQALYGYVDDNLASIRQKYRDTHDIRTQGILIPTVDLIAAIDAQIALRAEVFNRVTRRPPGTAL